MHTTIQRFKVSKSWDFYRVTLGKVTIIFKNGKVVAVETPHERYITEPNYKVLKGVPANVQFTFDHKNQKWYGAEVEPQLVDEEAILVHMNRMLWKQADEYITKKIKSRMVGKK